MSIAWGPTLDAEIAYRHQRVRDVFRHGTVRGPMWRRRAAKRATPPLAAQPTSTGWIVGRSQRA